MNNRQSIDRCNQTGSIEDSSLIKSLYSLSSKKYCKNCGRILGIHKGECPIFGVRGCGPKGVHANRKVQQ